MEKNIEEIRDRLIKHVALSNEELKKVSGGVDDLEWCSQCEAWVFRDHLCVKDIL